MTCECHKIDWMARVKNADKNYTMVDGSPLVPGVDCQDKVNLLKMDMNTYHGVCKYKPEEGSLLPEEVLQDILGEYQGSKPESEIEPEPKSEPESESESEPEPNLCESGRPHWNRNLPAILK